jgi:hypothetical protein
LIVVVGAEVEVVVGGTVVEEDVVLLVEMPTRVVVTGTVVEVDSPTGVSSPHPAARAHISTRKTNLRIELEVTLDPPQE